MEEEEHTDRQMQLALLSQKLQNIKTRYLTEDNTDNINKIISSNSPESCWTYLLNLEKKGNPHTDSNLLTKLMDCYSRVFSNLPLAKHSQNESYARMLVRFAELKEIQDPDEAGDHFNVARSNSKAFSFVHIAHAQFELSQGNAKKSTSILQRAFELNAQPRELLEVALQNLKAGKTQLLSTEDKENMAVPSLSGTQDPVKSITAFPKATPTSDGTGDLQLNSVLCPGLDQNNGPQEDPLAVWRPGPQRKRVCAMPGRVPLLPPPIPESDSNDDDERQKKKSDTSCPSSSLSRQTSGSRINPTFTFSSSKKSGGAGDSYSLLSLKPSIICPEPSPLEAADSTTTLLNRQDRKGSTRTDGYSENINQVVSSNSPESCWTSLLNLERKGNPHTDSSLLSKLIDCYTRVFSNLPLAKHSQNESYARMLVRFAELKAIEDADEAQDHFIIARTNCKTFAFVHIAHAQFKLSQGNAKKSASILQRAFELNAQPRELLEVALQNLKAGKTQLLSTEDKENMAVDPSIRTPPAVQSDGRERVEGNQLKLSSNLGQYKPVCNPPSDWKIPARISRHISPEDKRFPSNQMPTSQPADPMPTPSLLPPARGNPTLACETPKQKAFSANSFVTPVVRRNPPVMASVSVPHSVEVSQQPCTPQNQMSYIQQTPQGSVNSLSNETITIKGRQFFILKMIGQGGSSKVYQVLDHRKQLFAVKYVNLEEADAQTIESYKNEIEHLNHLQQYSDLIIKLYDYEITDHYIYMLMECGNLDLNTWLRKHKTVNPWERKVYWKKMLDAVQAIHKHGIVHSDLKPANFMIVNTSLKLIDFGISNRIQPDVTSIVKDSQVGTLNYMPPEAIKDTSSNTGKPSSKISPKGDVWSLGCILYCMTYGRTPFQKIVNQITKMHAIIDPSHEIEFPDIAEKDLLDVLKRCLVRNPKQRISVAELLAHPYLQMQPQPSPEPVQPSNNDLKRILNELAALQSPNSIARAANNLAKMCNSGKRLDVSECVRSSNKSS
ncbi:dual specificity protein kinase Ttk [Megalops cyprinoides]|uniref:dual specificity protein kinase Ttk n=1 Tax=Megalops cyprinoides TaxID=118141 RepID=UPI00186481B9|nr:dual specificity protein kinase Ttk [Megalops cyprinoides]